MPGGRESDSNLQYQLINWSWIKVSNRNILTTRTIWSGAEWYIKVTTGNALTEMKRQLQWLHTSLTAEFGARLSQKRMDKNESLGKTTPSGHIEKTVAFAYDYFLITFYTWKKIKIALIILVQTKLFSDCYIFYIIFLICTNLWYTLYMMVFMYIL